MSTHSPTCIWFPCTCDAQIEKIKQNEQIRIPEPKPEEAIQTVHQIQETDVRPDDKELVKE